MTRRGSPKNPLFADEDTQLGLFDAASSDRADPAEEKGRALGALAERLPKKLRFGTSSWTFPGWAGLVYHRRYGNQKTFLRESLGEYAKHPLMRTVGIDRGYYTPVPEDDLRSYATMLPDGFLAAMKVWQRVAMPGFPRHPRYGADAGKKNPSFLDASLFTESVHRPVAEGFAKHMGPWILEIAPSPFPLDPTWFCDRLSDFLTHVPRDFPFAVELRDRRLLTDRYAATLREHGASHVFNYWSRMPQLSEQMRLAGLLDGPLMVTRLLLPPGERYAELKEAYAPFDRLVAPQPRMREEVVRLIRTALERDAECFVLVNNKAEGSSPLTVEALAQIIAR